MRLFRLFIFFIFLPIFLVTHPCEGQSIVDQLNKKLENTKGEKVESAVGNNLEKVRKQITNLLQIDKSEIVFDGQFLFDVSASDQLTSKERAESVNLKLDKILGQIIKNQTAPNVSVKKRNGFQVITVNGDYILTVTEDDLHLSKYATVDELAKSWAYDLDNAFEKSVEQRLEDYASKAIVKTIIILALVLLASFAIYFLAQKALKGKIAVILIGLWVFTIFKILGIFPQTREWQYLLERGIFKPLFLLFLTVWLAIILNKLSYVLIAWYFQNQLPEAWSATNRKLNRALTIKKVSEASSDWFFTLGSLITFLVIVGVNITSVLTGAGLIGLAIGFIAQDLIKGVLNGLAILFEDQFGVGDIIRIGKYSGTVEAFSLRMTQLRNLEGMLITIPNKDISIVENFTKNFAQVDFSIGVDYSTDLLRAIEVVKTVGNLLAEEWPDKILQEPEILGIDKLKDFCITIRMLIKTLPMEQWRVKRELNFRIVQAFAKENIIIPIPQSEVRLVQANDEQDFSK
jgi:small-conductance mechanosensitive channel